MNSRSLRRHLFFDNADIPVSLLFVAASEANNARARVGVAIQTDANAIAGDHRHARRIRRKDRVEAKSQFFNIEFQSFRQIVARQHKLGALNSSSLDAGHLF